MKDNNWKYTTSIKHISIYVDIAHSFGAQLPFITVQEVLQNGYIRVKHK